MRIPRTGGGEVKAVIFGATGMVGQGVLRECLLDPDVEKVLAIVRNASLPQHDKLREIVHQDVSDLAAIEDRLSGYDACFFCLGVSAVFAAHCGVDVRSMAHRDVLGLPVDEVRSTPFHWNDPLLALAYFGQTIVDFLRPALKTAAAEPAPLEPVSARP